MSFLDSVRSSPLLQTSILHVPVVVFKSVIIVSSSILNKDLIGYGGFSTASGKDLKFSTSNLTKNLVKDVENQNYVLETNSTEENLGNQIDSVRSSPLLQTSILHVPVVVFKSVIIVSSSIFSIRLCAFDKIFSERGISFPDAVENLN
jgi:hypothetical protein